jgi:cytochrome c oxidase subunit 2
LIWLIPQDDIVVKELHIPKVRKYTLRCVLKMFFTHMPYFRANELCSMVTEFAFEPIYTTAEYRELPYMVKKVANINAIVQKSIGLVAKVRLH